VERGDRVEDAVALPWTAVAVEKGLDLPSRLGSGDEAGLAAAGRENAHERVMGW
jgi:hypothetical protein